MITKQWNREMRRKQEGKGKGRISVFFFSPPLPPAPPDGGDGYLLSSRGQVRSANGTGV